jgi:hypothetical protein
MKTAKRKSEPKLFKQNHEQNYDNGRSKLIRCANCCCQSCTGFRCPWTKYKKGYQPDGYIGRPWRCEDCYGLMKEKIFDCDYYTYYKRKRYYVKKKISRRKRKIDEIADKLDIIIKKLSED